MCDAIIAAVAGIATLLPVVLEYIDWKKNRRY